MISKKGHSLWIAAVLAGARETIDTSRRLNIVLVAGDKDHGPGEHDYPAWQRSWSTLLGSAENVAIDTAWVWPTDEQLAARTGQLPQPRTPKTSTSTAPGGPDASSATEPTDG